MSSTSQSSLQVPLALFNTVYLLELNSVELIGCWLKAGNGFSFFHIGPYVYDWFLILISFTAYLKVYHLFLIFMILLLLLRLKPVPLIQCCFMNHGQIFFQDIFNISSGTWVDLYGWTLSSQSLIHCWKRPCGHSNSTFYVVVLVSSYMTSQRVLAFWFNSGLIFSKFRFPHMMWKLMI